MPFAAAELSDAPAPAHVAVAGCFCLYVSCSNSAYSLVESGLILIEYRAIGRLMLKSCLLTTPHICYSQPGSRVSWNRDSMAGFPKSNSYRLRSRGRDQ